MTESEAEAEEGITPEVMPSQELSTVIKEVGLDDSLANEFRINFEAHFKMASTWAKKAKTIIVTDASQKVLMEEARTARLFLRSKRLEIESFRVQKKEYYVKGGRAIDKVANFLKDTIIPIEEHLDRQEHFVEYKKKAEDERLLAEARARMEVEEQKRIAEEAADRERLRVENERLKNEQKKLEKENEAKIAKEREARQAELAKIQAENEAKLLKEKQEREKVEEELRLKKQAEMKAEADKIREEEKKAQYGDNDWMLVLKYYLQNIPYPQVKSAENKRVLEDVKSYIGLAILKIKIINQEEE